MSACRVGGTGVAVSGGGTRGSRSTRVAGALVGEQARGDGPDLLAAPQGAQQPGVRHLADHRAVELPAVDHRLHLGEPRGGDDRDHPLLRLGDHHLPRLHVLLALRHPVEEDVDPVVGCHLRERGREPRGPAVLQREHEPALDELRRDLDQPLAGERVADLDRGPLVRVVLAQLGTREHRCPADPVAPGGRAVQHDERPGGCRLRPHEPLDGEQADAHRVDEAVRRVGVVEDDLAADVRHPDAVAVVAHAADRAREVVVGAAEAQPVEQCDRPGAHRGDVAQDPTDPGRRALERLDRRRMIVALGLEGDREPVAEIDDACVLSRALEDVRPLARQSSEKECGVLVAAVLRPEQREHRQLEVVGLAVEERDDTCELPVREAELTMERLFRDRAQGASLTEASGVTGSCHGAVTDATDVATRFRCLCGQRPHGPSPALATAGRAGRICGARPV